MKPAICAIHKRALICPACIGQKGGRVSTPKTRRAARKVGKLGGRPESKG